MTARPGPPLDRSTRACLAVIAGALAWLAAWTTVSPWLAPGTAEAQRETVTVNLQRIGGRHLGGGVLPVRCADPLR